MNNRQLLGKPVAEEMLKLVRKTLSTTKTTPRMDVILVGETPASVSYVRLKQKTAERLGVTCYVHQFDEDISESALLQHIHKLNDNVEVHGYIVQLPLPAHMNTQKIISAISPTKDIDGFTAENSGKLFLELQDEEYLVPATSLAVMHLLDFYNIQLKSAKVTVIGKSQIVGKPIALHMMSRGATVTVCHIQTKNLKDHTKNADIIIAATGVKHLIRKNMIGKNTVLVDVGFTKIGSTIYGDIHPECYKKALAYAPVPGGVGPITIASLFTNLLKCT